MITALLFFMCSGAGVGSVVASDSVKSAQQNGAEVTAFVADMTPHVVTTLDLVSWVLKIRNTGNPLFGNDDGGPELPSQCKYYGSLNLGLLGTGDLCNSADFAGVAQ